MRLNEDLIEQFNDWLDYEYGTIDIEGMSVRASLVLQSMSPDDYHRAFVEFCNDLKDQAYLVDSDDR